MKKPGEHMKLKEILELLGETYETEQEWRNAKKRLARRLRNMEELLGMPLLFGKEGSALWSTKDALRHAWPALVPAEAGVNDKVAEVAEGIVSRFEDRLATLEAQQNVMAAAISKLSRAEVFRHAKK